MHQAVSKTIPLASVMHDDDVAHAWVSDKLERQASWSELRAVLIMLEGALGVDVVRRCTVPGTCLVRPLASYEARERRGARMFLVNT